MTWLQKGKTYWRMAAILALVMTGLVILESILGLYMLGAAVQRVYGERQASTASLIAGLMEKHSIRVGNTIAFVPAENPSLSQNLPSTMAPMLNQKLKFYVQHPNSKAGYIVRSRKRWRILPSLGISGVAPVRSPSGHLLGMVVISPKNQDIRQVVTHAGIRLAVVSVLVILILSIWAGLRLFSRLTRNLKVLQNAAIDFGKGDMNCRVTELAKPFWGDEVAQLAHAFDSMAQRIAEDSVRRKQFFAEISHELATPLTTIGTYIETLLMEDVDQELDPCVRREMLLTAGREVERLDRLVDDIVDLAKLDAGELRFSPTPTDIVALIRETLTKNQREFTELNIVTELVSPSSLPFVLADPIRLSQILSNLISNSIKAMTCGGHLRIVIHTTGHLPGKVCISISDTGMGIPPEELPFIFDQFYRGSNSKGLGAGGRGLGLAITKRLIELHSGTVWVDSQLGKGTTLNFTLPAVTL